MATTPLVDAPTISLSARDVESIRHAVKVLKVRAGELDTRTPALGTMLRKAAASLRAVVEQGADRPTRITTGQYHALGLAAKMLDERANQTTVTVRADDLRASAAVVQLVHDRHHRAFVVAETGQPHAACAWCANAA